MGLPGKILNLLFVHISTSSDLLAFLHKERIDIGWVIEAGGHQGFDSTVFIDHGLTSFIFEPDSIARQLLITRLRDYANGTYFVYPQALSNVSVDGFLQYDSVLGPGSGSSKISLASDLSINYQKVDKIRLSEFQQFRQESKAFFFESNKPNGLLWLDVEGHALEVLEGCDEVLDFIAAAQIEVEFQPMIPLWSRANFLEIVKFMNSKGFVLNKFYSQPTYRGDVLFIRQSLISNLSLLKSFFIQISSILIHGYLFKLLFKFRNHLK